MWHQNSTITEVQTRVAQRSTFLLRRSSSASASEESLGWTLRLACSTPAAFSKEDASVPSSVSESDDVSRRRFFFFSLLCFSSLCFLCFSFSCRSVL